jgi:hypothetical protein
MWVAARRPFPANRTVWSGTRCVAFSRGKLTVHVFIGTAGCVRRGNVVEPRTARSDISHNTADCARGWSSSRTRPWSPVAGRPHASAAAIRCPFPGRRRQFGCKLPRPEGRGIPPHNGFPATDLRQPAAGCTPAVLRPETVLCPAGYSRRGFCVPPRYGGMEAHAPTRRRWLTPL